MVPSIDFSAQFGGRDAAQVVLPHFKALKRAARETSLTGFPFPKLAFILRVDGEVNTYGFRGAAHIDIDRKGDYVSVDIGIPLEDRDRLGQTTGRNVIREAILASISLLQESDDERLSGSGTDFNALSAAIQTLCERYEANVSC